ncbi:MAG: sugar phosphate isomerase/epimerase [Planctomycetes bacterium]|nr:sugar phosphate isomerase/epimerase [Planctomycetota bacterium]
MLTFVSTTCVPECRDLRRALDWMAAEGFDRVEIGSYHLPLADPVAEALRGAPRRRLIVHNYFPPAENPFIVNIGSADPAVLAKSVAQVKRAIDTAKAVGAELYTFHPAFLVDPAPPEGKKDSLYWPGRAVTRERAWEIFLPALRDIIAHADRAGQRVAIENQGSVKENDSLMMTQPWEWRDLMAETRATSLGVLVDVGHLKLSAVANKFRREELLEAVEGRIYAFHAHDNDGQDDQHRPVGEGAWFLSTIRQARFERTPVVLESWDLTPDQVRASLAAMEG